MQAGAGTVLLPQCGVAGDGIVDQRKIAVQCRVGYRLSQDHHVGLDQIIAAQQGAQFAVLHGQGAQFVKMAVLVELRDGLTLGDGKFARTKMGQLLETGGDEILRRRFEHAAGGLSRRFRRMALRGPDPRHKRGRNLSADAVRDIRD